MKKFNVTRSAEGKNKKSSPEKRMFYSLLLCVPVVALCLNFFYGKTTKKFADAAVKNGQTDNRELPEIHIPSAEEENSDLYAADTGNYEEEVSEENSGEIPEENYEESDSADIPLSAVTKPVNGEILKVFSDKTPVYSKTMNDWRPHNGIDISAKIGDSVFACANGITEAVFEDKNMGMTVIINHGAIKSKYQNLAPGVTVKAGDEVREGDTIGVVGDSAAFEISDLPHLHFEIYEGEIQKNPETMFKR